MTHSPQMDSLQMGACDTVTFKTIRFSMIIPFDTMLELVFHQYIYFLKYSSNIKGWTIDNP